MDLGFWEFVCVPKWRNVAFSVVFSKIITFHIAACYFLCKTEKYYNQIIASDKIDKNPANRSYKGAM